MLYTFHKSGGESKKTVVYVMTGGRVYRIEFNQIRSIPQ